jgi:hypothetical protein
MSTRANIIIKDKYNKLIFYRHSDGYPKGTLPTLNLFLDLVKNGTIRDNVEQASGWLIMIGAIEYKTVTPESFEMKGEEDSIAHYTVDLKMRKYEYSDLMGWKVGAYEPATDIHGDIEYLYTVDLVKKKITYKKV